MRAAVDLCAGLVEAETHVVDVAAQNFGLKIGRVVEKMDQAMFGFQVPVTEEMALSDRCQMFLS